MLLKLWAALPSSALAQPSDPVVLDVDRFETARNSGDLQSLLALFDDGAVVTDAEGGRHVGSPAISSLLQASIVGERAAWVSLRRVDGDQSPGLSKLRFGAQPWR